MRPRRALLALLLLAGALIALPGSGEEPPAAPTAAPQAEEAVTVTEADLFTAPAETSSPADAGPFAPLFAGEDCNEVVCGKGQVCCSYSCSLCGFAGGACPDVMCP